jgi:hypothetical protein
MTSIDMASLLWRVRERTWCYHAVMRLPNVHRIDTGLANASKHICPVKAMGAYPAKTERMTVSVCMQLAMCMCRLLLRIEAL